MHINIMEVGSRDRPPMLAMGRYAQWQSHFMRYVDTKPNGATLNKCILQGPYVLSNIILLGQPTTDNSLAITERTIPETFSNISPEYKAHYDAEAKAIHLILTGIRDDIYSTIDACKTTYYMWIAIERLQQGESLNKQDVKTSLFWECGRFTSRDGESIESYYFRFYKMMNEMYQKEVNEIRAEKIARNANPLALVADGKEIVKPITPPSESASNEDSDLEQTRRDKDMEKNLALIAKNPKRAKDYTYHKEKMLLCKQAEKGVSLQAEQSDWLEDTDEEIDEQELEAHYRSWQRFRRSYLQTQEKADRNATECDDKRVALANLITNLTLDIEENKKIQKQLKKANASLAQELKECKIYS
ncbi:hypothetical protein Tco_0887123 [Tanacetum coccineum]